MLKVLDMVSDTLKAPNKWYYYYKQIQTASAMGMLDLGGREK